MCISKLTLSEQHTTVAVWELAIELEKGTKKMVMFKSCPLR